MDHISFKGDRLEITIHLPYIPQATMYWWKHLLRATRGAANRNEGLRLLREYINCSCVYEDYTLLIPRNRDEKALYLRTHGERARVPSRAHLAHFAEKLPQINYLIELALEGDM